VIPTVDTIKPMIQSETDSSIPVQSPVRSVRVRVFRELLFGSRGILKMSHLWIALSALFVDANATLDQSVALILAVLCRIQFSILANDLSDKETDLAAGKSRWIHNLPPAAGWLIAAALLASGLSAVLLWGGSIGTTLIYAASAFCAFAYSQRPFRFKERGKLGLLVYALSSVLIYVAVPCTWFGASPRLLLFMTAAVGSDKWIQIHFHQVVDYSADLKTGASTYAVQAGLDRARTSLKTASLIASVCLFAAVAYLAAFTESVVTAGVVAVILTAGLVLSKAYTGRMKSRAVPASALVRELPWFYLGLSYFVFYVLPIILFIGCALNEPRVWILAAVASFFAASVSLQSHRYQYN
jgi:hypothetical protein